MSQSAANQRENDFNYARSYRNTNIFDMNRIETGCTESSKRDSMIMECSDDSMLKLQFGKCTNVPSKLF